VQTNHKTCRKIERDMVRKNGASANSVIVRRPGVMGGSPIIEGTRIRVADIVGYRRLWRSNRTRQALGAFPDITSEEVQAALEYYAQHQDEIDEEMREEEAIAAECRASQAFT
jgi:uncharacterized protein (DUF433 family)